mmetsp:Transcript_6842/g.11749  ORF Transcript_6842/g.11749 Transcript_6842/m.11749 type:complete len:228 (+) Transcript_6842:141-824(+)
MKFTYFACRGTGDMIRLLLEETGLRKQTEEVIISAKEFKALKSELPFGSLPMLGPGVSSRIFEQCILFKVVFSVGKEDANMKISHAPAIMRYLARISGTYGNNLEESTTIDSWAEECMDMLRDLWNTPFMVKELAAAQAAEAKNKYLTTLNFRLGFFAKGLSGSKSEGGFLVGSQLSYADVVAASVLDAISKELPLVLPAHPVVQKYFDGIKARPQLAAFWNSPDRF